MTDLSRLDSNVRDWLDGASLREIEVLAEALADAAGLRGAIEAAMHFREAAEDCRPLPKPEEHGDG